MYTKDFILLSISEGEGRPVNTSGETADECLKVARRQIRHRIANPVAVVNRKGEVQYDQKQIISWVVRH